MLLKASKYDEAAELAEKWLECEENFSLELKYCQIAGCYIKHILFPQGLFENIQRFLRRNQVLTPEQREVRDYYSCVISIGKSMVSGGIWDECCNWYCISKFTKISQAAKRQVILGEFWNITSQYWYLILHVSACILNLAQILLVLANHIAEISQPVV